MADADVNETANGAVSSSNAEENKQLSGKLSTNTATESATSSQVKKKKKNKKNSSGATSDVSNDVASKDTETKTKQQYEALAQAMELLHKQQQSNQSTSAVSVPRTIDEAKKRQYQFWDTQPVPKINETITCNEAIETDVPASEIRQEQYSLPGDFYWDDVDINNTSHLRELYTLLNENYVEDEDNMFRFDYSPQFLQWALMPPGWLPQWHCGVRVAKNDKLVCFISAVPAHIQIHDKEKRMVEINFLCVHKKLRKKRVAPVLIREITRRVNCTGLFQAVYTGGVVLPKPLATCRYWHRSLNPKKLIECRFSSLSKNMTMARTVKLYKLPDEPQIIGFKRMQLEHEEAAHALLSEYLAAYRLSPIFNFEEFQHWFRSREGIVDSYIVEKEGVVTDFCSFYTLPSSVIQHPLHKTLKAAYSFYNVARGTPWVDLMRDALISARNTNFDVFNALDLMENKEFLEDLKFGVGDGNLHYYLFNWKCPQIKANEVGLVLQ